jgi:putative sterol carrier protein
MVPTRGRVMSNRTATSDTATAFFEQLAERGHEPLLGKASGTVCVELTDGTSTETWLVTIDRGDLTVFQGTANADCTLRASKELFEQVVTGEVNAVAAVLRGAIGVEGDSELLVLFQRLFPGRSAAAAAESDAGARGPSR